MTRSRQRTEKPKADKTTRQRKQRQVRDDRLTRQALQQRADTPDVLPVREDDDGRYRP